MKTKDVLFFSVMGLLILLALVFTMKTVKSRYFSTKARISQLQTKYIKNWDNLRIKGYRNGPKNAPVQIVKFFDYQCIYCKSMAPVLNTIQQKYSGQVSFINVHYPLSYHSLAFEAAIAAECARKQNKFKAFHDLLFAHQNKIGTFAYDSLAAVADISNITYFKRCMENKERAKIVQLGIDFAKNINVDAVPAFIINGKLITGVLSQEQFKSLVEEALAEAE